MRKLLRSRKLITISLAIVVILFFEHIMIYSVITSNNSNNDDEIVAQIVVREIADPQKVSTAVTTTATVPVTHIVNIEGKISHERKIYNNTWSQKAAVVNVYHNKKLSSLGNSPTELRRAESKDAEAAFIRQVRYQTGGEQLTQSRQEESKDAKAAFIHQVRDMAGGQQLTQSRQEESKDVAAAFIHQVRDMAGRQQLTQSRQEESKDVAAAFIHQVKQMTGGQKLTGGQNSQAIWKIVTFTGSRRKQQDYDYWLEVGRVGEAADEDYPFYTDDSWPSPAKTAAVPPHIASLFPTQLSNTTFLFSPPHPPFVFKRFTDVLTNKNIEIFDLLARWENVSLPFSSSRVRRLKLALPEKSPPLPRKCKLSPSESFKNKHNSFRWKRNVECYNSTRELTPFELDGNHILFTIRTTARLHSTRLPLLFQTWLTNLNRSNVVIVTDGIDPILQYRSKEAGLKYLVSVPGYEKLCDKAGDELSLMFLPENSHYEWFCHIDDDMYVNLDRLVSVLALFKRDDPIYFGRAGTKPGEPRRVRPDAKLGTPGTPYNFAVGGMYCLNRPLLNKARRWIGGRSAFRTMCSLTNEPEDVTVGFVVGIVLGLDLNQTELIHSHGNDLSSVNPAILKHQVGISYGFGSVQWGFKPNNVVTVPQRLFTFEDPSQFLSLHCHYHKHVGWCVNRQRTLLRAPYPYHNAAPAND